jgi:anti-sigma factor RsiW
LLCPAAAQDVSHGAVRNTLDITETEQRVETSEDLSCAELVELVTEYLEGTLPPEHRVRFEEHLVDCDGCSNYVQQMRTTIRLTGRLSEVQLDSRMKDALLATFRNWKRPG